MSKLNKKNEILELFLILRYFVSPGQKIGFKLAGNYLSTKS